MVLSGGSRRRRAGCISATRRHWRGGGASDDSWLWRISWTGALFVGEVRDFSSTLLRPQHTHGEEEAGAAVPEQRLLHARGWHGIVCGVWCHGGCSNSMWRRSAVDDEGMLPSVCSLSFMGGKNSGRKLAQTLVCANDGGALGRCSLLDRVVVES